MPGNSTRKQRPRKAALDAGEWFVRMFVEYKRMTDRLVARFGRDCIEAYWVAASVEGRAGWEAHAERQRRLCTRCLSIGTSLIVHTRAATVRERMTAECIPPPDGRGSLQRKMPHNGLYGHTAAGANPHEVGEDQNKKLAELVAIRNDEEKNSAQAMAPAQLGTTICRILTDVYG